jgi:putative transposase
MTDHMHLLVTPQDKEGLSRLMQYVGRRYVPYVNQEYGRTGTLTGGTVQVELGSGPFVLACMLPLHRVESGSRRHGRGTGGLGTVH